MRVKICGITNPEDALAAARCGADFLGLVLAASPREVTTDTVRRVLAVLPSNIQPVLVFRDAPMEDVLSVVESTGCEWVQLHGREPVSGLRDLMTRRAQTHIIKAWEVSSPASGDALLEYLADAQRADVQIEAVILDVPKSEAPPGFECLAGISTRCLHRPPEIWCAGGLTPTNLATALAGGRYDGVDVSSGVELRPGIKSHAAVLQFIETAKRL